MNINDINCIESAKCCIGLDKNKPYTRHGKKFYKPNINEICVQKYDVVWNTLESMKYAKHWMVNRDGSTNFYLTRNGLDWLGDKIGIYIYDAEN